MRRSVILGCAAALWLGACGGGDNNLAGGEPTSTSPPCDAVSEPVTPVTGAGEALAVYLTRVQVVGDRCTDRVTFDVRSDAPDPPGYRVTYGTSPFTEDASGAPVAIAGRAFVVVRLEPAYSYDFENGEPVYDGPERIAAPGAAHVTEVVETGDYEAVMTWVIGLDERRPFSVQATGAPAHQLVITIS